MGFSLDMFFNDLLLTLDSEHCSDEEKFADLMVIIRSGYQYAAECGVVSNDLPKQ